MKFFKWLFIVLLVLAGLLYVSNNNHIYLGLYDTYLQGRTHPAVDDPDLFPTRVLKCSQPKPWPVAKNYNTQRMSDKIQSIHKEYGTLAFLVLKNDSLIQEEYFEHYNKNTLSNSFSIAKTFLSMITGVALKEGKIQIHDPVSNYVPELLDAKNKDLQIVHLLNMTSGMNFDENYANPIGFMAKSYYGTNLKELVKGHQLEEKPGTHWKYLGGNNLLLSFALEKALEQKVGEYAQEKLWEPLGMENEGRWILDQENGDEKTFSGLYASARDFAKLGKLYLDKGVINGQSVIDSNYVMQSIQPVNKPDEDGKQIDYYGYAWWLNTYKGLKVFYMQGIQGQYVFCIPEKNIIIVRLGKKRMKKSNGIVPDDVFIYLEEGIRLAEKK